MIRSERGANLVEAAIVVPFLVLLLAGVADFGRAFQTYIVITNSAREGARTGARLSCYSNNSIQRETYRAAIVQATIDAAAGNGVAVAAGDIEISPDPADGTCPDEGQAVVVTVQHDMTTILGGVIQRATIHVASQAAMSKFGPPVVQPAP